GIGNSTGTGAATARLFSKEGYSVALIARGQDSLKSLAEEITKSGGNASAVAFPVPSYSWGDISTAWDGIRARFPSPTYSIRAAVFNIAFGVWGPFLQTTPAQVEESLSTNVAAGFAFSREAILEFKKNELSTEGKRGTLIFTGATASMRGNVTTSAFAAGKFGLRALSQSLAKEFGKENIHVRDPNSVSIIDGAILTDRWRDFKGDGYNDFAANIDGRLSPESIAKSYLYLVGQERSSWTWELDLRPAHEKW
ncbi:hypothetical protein BD779DRAFT_1442958, partial [Infundibulicybe gibba]